MSFARDAYAAVQRNPMQTIGWVLGIVLIGIVALRGENTRDKVVTVVNSPCFKDVGGKPCQKTKQRSDEERSVPSTCVLFYKVDKGGKLLRLTKCEVEKPGGPTVEPGEVATTTGGADPPKSGGGDADHQPAPKGHEQPSPQAGGHEKPEGAVDPDTGPPPSAKPSASEGNPEPSPSPDTHDEKGPVEAAGQVVTETTEAAAGLLEETGEAVCRLTQGC